MSKGMKLKAALTAAVIAVVVAACATSPTGRRQLQLFAADDMAQMGDAAYQEIKKETPTTASAAQTGYVDCVVRHLTKVVPKPVDGGEWRVTVFDEPDNINAFALPGGNVGVYTGLLKVTKNQSQLAAVIGHELAHVQANHGNARLSTQYATQAGVALLGVLAGASTNGDKQQIMSLLGVGATVGVILPFSRSQESEADIIGLRYMAEAGFDPRESVGLWRNMMAASGGSGGPQFLSTHPAGETRIETLEKHMSEAMGLYERAQAQGRRPNCR